ncbi:MAG: hypothetical protein ACRD4I_08640 [Candidatus Angelobacter sp.]
MTGNLSRPLAEEPIGTDQPMIRLPEERIAPASTIENVPDKVEDSASLNVLVGSVNERISGVSQRLVKCASKQITTTIDAEPTNIDGCYNLKFSRPESLNKKCRAPKLKAPKQTAIVKRPAYRPINELDG